MYVNPLIGIKNNEKCIRFLSGCNEKGRKRTLSEVLALQLTISCFPPKESGTLSTRKSHILIRNDMGVNEHKTLYNCVWPPIPSRHEEAMC